MEMKMVKKCCASNSSGKETDRNEHFCSAGGILRAQGGE